MLPKLSTTSSLNTVTDLSQYIKMPLPRGDLDYSCHLVFHNQNNFATLICSPKPTIPPIVLRRILSLSISHITQHHSLYANKSDSSSSASCNLCARKPRNLRYFRLTCTNEIQIFDNVQRTQSSLLSSATPYARERLHKNANRSEFH